MINYIKSHLLWLYSVIRVYILASKIRNHHSNDKCIAVYVTPWFGTLVTIYTIYLGLLLKHKYGRKLKFIFQDVVLCDRKINPRFQYGYLFILKLILRNVGDVITTSSISFDKKTHTISALSKKYAHIDFVHDYKTEIIDYETNCYKKHLGDLNLLNTSIESLLEIHANDMDFIIAPGGLSLSTGILRELCGKKNIRFVSFDSGRMGEYILSVTGVASYLDDAALAYKRLYHNLSNHSKSAIKKSVNQSISDKRSGKDKFRSQASTSNTSNYTFGNKHKSVLLILNVCWDGASLGQIKIFESQLDWILNTINWVLNNTNYNVYIRQHPAERFDFAKSNENYKLHLATYLNNPRVKFISSSDDCSTYYLIEKSNLVVTLTSTIALESIIMGIPAMSISDCYYVKAGIVKSPNSVIEYYNLISALVEKSDVSCNFSYDKVYFLYYIAQVMTWIETDFLPSDNYKLWLKYDLDMIFELPYVKSILESITTGKTLYEQIIEKELV